MERFHKWAAFAAPAIILSALFMAGYAWLWQYVMMPIKAAEIDGLVSGLYGLLWTRYVFQPTAAKTKDLA